MEFKKKVSELEGAELDYWVAQAEGMLRMVSGTIEHQLGGYSPSTKWAHGGPLIDREHIALIPSGKQWRAGYEAFAVVEGAAYDTGPTAAIELYREHCGDSPLVAAMRAFVESKFGQEVPLVWEIR